MLRFFDLWKSSSKQTYLLKIFFKADKLAQERARRFGEGSERMTGMISQFTISKLNLLIPQELLAGPESLRISKREMQMT